MSSSTDRPVDRTGRGPGSDAEELFSAIENGNIPAVQRLISGNHSLLSARNQRGESPVLVACYRHRADALQVLLAARPELNIWEAAAAGQLQAVRDQLERNGSLLAEYSQDGWTPLHLAAFFGHPDVVAELLRRDADVDAWSKNGLANQPLHAAAAGGNTEVCRLLIEAGADVNTRQHGGGAPLHSAAQNGNQSLVELLLDNGADRSARTSSGDTPAALATKAGRPSIAALLK